MIPWLASSAINALIGIILVYQGDTLNGLIFFALACINGQLAQLVTRLKP
jgi:hypothetical protein